MSILSDLSRRFHLLTTDAKPDPPRVPIEGHTHNLEPVTPSEKAKRNSRSAPITPEPEQEGETLEQAEKSRTNFASPINTPHSEKPDDSEDARPSASQYNEQKKPGFKSKSKSRQYRHPQGGNPISYNIINSNGVKIGARTSYICNVNQFATNATPSNQWTKPKFRDMPVEVERLSTCTDEITLDDMFIVKTHVGHGWRDVARRLSYSEGQIEQFEENYRHRGVDEVVYQLLVDWKQANTKDAEIGRLVKALWSCQEYDCTERLTAGRSKPT